MTPQQELAINCAYADLVGAYQAREYPDIHDWRAHLASIRELENSFPDIIDTAPLDDEE